MCGSGAGACIAASKVHGARAFFAGETYTVATTDVLKLGNDGAAVPSVGDRVKVKGRVALTKKRCADEGATLEDRYQAPDVKRVTISDREPAAPETETPETETTEPTQSVTS